MSATRRPTPREQPGFHFTVIDPEHREHGVTVFAETASLAFAAAQRMAPRWHGKGSVVDAVSVRRRTS